jgi:hypothetical protein
VHIPCDKTASPWRVVSHGVSPCLSCELVDPATEGPVIDGVQRSCASENEAAACCRQEGHGCSNLNLDPSSQCAVGAAMVCSACDDPNMPPTGAHVGRFIAVGREMTHSVSIDYCEEHYQSLASISSWDEQQQAASACSAYSQVDVPSLAHGTSYGCWIGLQDYGQEGQFSWLDGSSVSFVRWAPGEPGNKGHTDGVAHDENAVNMDFRNWGTGKVRNGEWNDDDETYMMFPICETSIPAPVPGSPMTWGGTTTASFRVRICIDHDDFVYFQDDRFWVQYGGQYSAAGAHGDCPDRYKGRAYINSQEWDISALGDCEPGGHCPVSPTFTDEQFEVPMGCDAVTMTAQTMRGRGEVTTEAPSAGNAWRGGLHIADHDGGSAVYDVRVTLTCPGGASSEANGRNVRLSCTHNYGTSSCHMGRIEVFNPSALHVGSSGAGTWGTVCGHWYWSGASIADIVCKQLGYASGDTYTFGHTNQLPTLPIVAGFRMCTGTERDIFTCPKPDADVLVAVTSPDAPAHGQPVDYDCLHGCLGPDHLQGTLDDGVDPTCTHSLDQGAICNNEWGSQVALPHCGADLSMAGGLVNTAGVLAGQGNYEQPILFSCIDYYTTECAFDVTNTNLAAGFGSYMEAMRAFAQCADTSQEQPGYCHGALLDAKLLANSAVCTNGATENIGFHIRIPLKINMPGTYVFRMHADYGLGAYIGVDGAEFTGGGTWGHARSGLVLPQ